MLQRHSAFATTTKRKEKKTSDKSELSYEILTQWRDVHREALSLVAIF